MNNQQQVKPTKQNKIRKRERRGKKEEKENYIYSHIYMHIHKPIDALINQHNVCIPMHSHTHSFTHVYICIYTYVGSNSSKVFNIFSTVKQGNEKNFLAKLCTLLKPMC